MKVQKGTTVRQFLEACRTKLSKEYKYLEKINSEDLILIVRNTILPSKMSFYDILMHKIKNNKDELLIQLNCKKTDEKNEDFEVDENLICKIIERSKYDASRHIYPCSIWSYLDTTTILD